MSKSPPGEKREKEFTPEEIEGLERTLEFMGPSAEEEEKSLAAVVEHARAKEEELKKGVKDSWESIIGEPVDVIAIKYLGDGIFECVIAFGEKDKRQRRAVTIKEPEKKF